VFIDKINSTPIRKFVMKISFYNVSYGTRVWASLISKPQILFDVDVPSHAEPCLDILRQVFIDSFTLGTQNVSKVKQLSD